MIEIVKEEPTSHQASEYEKNILEVYICGEISLELQQELFVASNQLGS